MIIILGQKNRLMILKIIFMTWPVMTVRKIGYLVTVGQLNNLHIILIRLIMHQEVVKGKGYDVACLAVPKKVCSVFSDF